MTAHNRQRATLYSYAQQTGGIEVERANTGALARDLGLKPVDFQAELSRLQLLGKLRPAGRRLRILGPKPTSAPSWPPRTLHDGLRLILGGRQ